MCTGVLRYDPANHPETHGNHPETQARPRESQARLRGAKTGVTSEDPTLGMSPSYIHKFLMATQKETDSWSSWQSVEPAQDKDAEEIPHQIKSTLLRALELSKQSAG